MVKSLEALADQLVTVKKVPRPFEKLVDAKNEVWFAHQHTRKDRKSMNSKTLLLLGAVGALAMSSAEAQVYSVNAVGYVNKTIPTGFSMISNPLKTANDTLRSVIPTAPDGTTAFYWNGTAYASLTYDGLDAAWGPAGVTIPFAPGSGIFIRNSSGAPFTVTFVGDVSVGALSNPLPTGFTIKSSMVPQAGTTTALGFPGVDGNTIFKYVNNGTGGGAYTSSTYDGLDAAWTPTQLSFEVGEAFWVRVTSAQTWNRTFSVN